jgi:hypothetical protein
MEQAAVLRISLCSQAGLPTWFTMVTSIPIRPLGPARGIEACRISAIWPIRQSTIAGPLFQQSFRRTTEYESTKSTEKDSFCFWSGRDLAKQIRVLLAATIGPSATSHILSLNAKRAMYRYPLWSVGRHTE